MLYVSIIVFILIIYYFLKNGLVKTKASNNKIYYTQKSNAVMAAEKLVKIDIFLEKLNKHLLEDHKDHKMIQKKLKNNVTIKELPKNSKHIGYIINKNTLHICLRNKNGQFINKYNKIYFVVMHELAHMITKSVGHTDEYWNNYKLIIKTAIKHNLYKYKDYYNNPVKYCGIDINSSPYIKGGELLDNRTIYKIISIVILIFIAFILYKYFYNNNTTCNINDVNDVNENDIIIYKDSIVNYPDCKMNTMGEILKKRSDGQYVVDTEHPYNSILNNTIFNHSLLEQPLPPSDYKFNIDNYEKKRERQI